MQYKKIAVIGPGLLGGSLLLKCRSLSREVQLFAWVRPEEWNREIETSLQKHRITGSTQLATVVQGADLVVLATPVTAMPELVKEMRDALAPSTLVTDVGSVKGWVEEHVAPLLENRTQWIGSHPMAGSHLKGFQAAQANLFDNAMVILTPTEKTPMNTLEAAHSFWSMLTQKIHVLPPDEHDRLIAQISHVPHLAAVLLMVNAEPAAWPLRGGGFRDTTRVAAAPAALWRDILLTNQKSILDSLDHFIELATQTRQWLAEKDADRLNDLLERASQIRNTL